ncbi:MAG TPA: polymorphic toxin type 15 domain-containing protein [Flavisolibacter sp.]|jgi:hypothetical protein|nr:polymorphic toxin type 15 domain-containing protein [Flavisolibacter sp.]
MQAAEKTPTATPAKQQPNAAANRVYKYIHPEITESVFLSKLAKTQKLSKNNKTTKSAAEKIEESKKAQDTPAEENKSVSNQGQVDELRNKKIDPKSEAESKNALEQGMSNAVPKSLEAMDDFKSSGKGRQIGKAVLAKVNSDVASVKSGFGGIAVAKAPAPGEKGAPLPLMEQVPPTEEMHLGTGVLPPIDKKDLDTSQYVNQSDDLLKQGAISQEQLNMVDKGDLATANKERQNLQKAAVEEPAAIQQVAVTEQKTLNGRLHSEEKNAKADMQKHRQHRLTETGSKQEQAKLNLEKKREEVAKEINRRYEVCQKNITEKLDALEKNSLVQFDKGQETATKEFENQVNSDIKKFKDRRYDRIGGSLLWLKDKIFGIDDFPEVKQAFDRARADFVVKIDALIGSITKTNNEVITTCKKELEATKAGIAVYVASLGPLLRDVGKKAQEEVSEKLKALGSEIEKRKEKMQQQLAEKREAAMQAIDKKIEKMKEALSGALSVIGKLLLEAAKKFFKWALEKLGVDAEGFFETLSKAGAAIKAIFKGPGKFFSNLIDAVKGSINDFKTNFKTYIISALVDWLTGTMGSTGIQIPKEFTVKSVIGMLLQVLGLTWSFFRGKLVALIGEEKVAWAEKAVDVVVKFVTGGVSAVWDWIKEQAETIKNTFIDSLKDWLLIQLVKGFAEWIVSLLIPGGAILKLIQGIYKLVMWFVDNIQRILKWVNAVLNSLGNIALGAIAAAVGFIVTGIRSIIPAILDFFAKLLNISGIVEAVKKIIKKVSDPIHKAIDVAINWVVDKVKKMFGKGKEVKAPPIRDAATQEKVEKGLEALDAEEDKFDETGKITQEHAETVAARVKQQHPVFKYIKVVDGGSNWDFEYAASASHKKKGKKEKKEQNELRIKVYKIVPPFIVYAGNPSEFMTQLKRQESGLNSMKVSNWIKNREDFVKNGRQAGDLDKLREEIREDIAKAYRSREGNNLKKQGLTNDQIVSESELYAKTILTRYHAVLHNPDQVAGGDAFLSQLYQRGDITDAASLKASKLIGHLGTNSSIGSQWGANGHERVVGLYNHVIKETQTMTDQEKQNTLMNVVLI